MNSELAPPVIELVSDSPPVRESRDSGREQHETLAKRLLRVPIALWKLCFGALCGTSFLLSFLVVGWAQRVARREVLKAWWKRARHTTLGPSFAEFAADDERTREHVHWPNWFLLQSVQSRELQLGKSRIRRGSQLLLGSFASNAKLGIQSAFNTAVLLLPATGLWALGWFLGWQISFNKAYEHFGVGPGLFIAGILWFCIAMFYVPLAQARQASTGQWRTFYQFGFVWRCARHVWLQNCGLALLALALSIPALILKTLPTFWPQMSDALRDLPPPRQLQRIETYFLFVAFYGVPAFVYFRMVAARVYARAIVSGLQSGALTPNELGDDERHELDRLGLLSTVPKPTPHWARRITRSFTTRTGRIVAGLATLLIWLIFVFNVMIHEFFNHHDAGRGWWNQPTLQLPWFDYTPSSLREAAKDFK